MNPSAHEGEFGAALTTVLLVLFKIVINTVIVTAGNFEP